MTPTDRPPTGDPEGPDLALGARTGWLSLVQFLNRRTMNARTVRRIGIRAYATLVRANQWLPPPRVFMNGPGKSGTHLLARCLSLMPKLMFSGRHFALGQFAKDPALAPYVDFHERGRHIELHLERLQRLLHACPQGMFVTAHARYRRELAALLERLGFRQVFLFRDPRDVVVSYTHFVTNARWHHHHQYYTGALRDEEERIMATIRGFDQVQSGLADTPPLTSIGDSFRSYLAWTEETELLSCSFEDLVGPHGAGTRDRQIKEIRRIGDYLDRPLSAEAAAVIGDRMYSRGTLTFRKGRIGDWREHFTPSHREAMKETANDVLISLGYEQSDAW